MFHNLKQIHSFGTEAQRADYLMWARSEMTRGIQFAPNVTEVTKRAEWTHIMMWAESYLRLTYPIRETLKMIQAQSPRLLASCARLHNLLDQVDELGETFINVPVRSLD